MDDIIRLNISVKTLQKQMHSMKKQRMAEHGFLHSGEFSLMRQIAKYQHEYSTAPTLVMLASKLEISQATVTTLVDRLIKKELVIKTQSETDKRSKRISLSDKGYEFLKFNREKELAGIKSIYEILGEADTNEFIRILDKISAHYNNE